MSASSPEAQGPEQAIAQPRRVQVGIPRLGLEPSRPAGRGRPDSVQTVQNVPFVEPHTRPRQVPWFLRDLAFLGNPRTLSPRAGLGRRSRSLGSKTALRSPAASARG